MIFSNSTDIAKFNLRKQVGIFLFENKYVYKNTNQKSTHKNTVDIKVSRGWPRLRYQFIKYIGFFENFPLVRTINFALNLWKMVINQVFIGK